MRRRTINVRRGAILAVVTAAHALLVVLLVRATAPIPPIEAAPQVTPVYLADLRPRPRTEPRHAAKTPSPAAVAGGLALPVETPSAAAQAPSIAAAPAPSAEDAQADLALARALRGSAVGCANLGLLSARERARCAAQLADGARTAPYIAAPLAPATRHFYDAVAKAKRPITSGDIVLSAGRDKSVQWAKGGGMVALLDSDAGVRHVSGHQPGPVCGTMKPAHALKLGPLPCYIIPPQGPLTVEADIKNPDTVVNDPAKAEAR